MMGTSILRWRRVWVFALVLVFSLPLSAGDKPPAPQGPGEHSTVACSGGSSVRDDEIAETIRDNLPEDAGGNPQVKDVKVFFQCCYGGGILDDIHRVLSYPETPPGGIPWVGGSAADPNEYSWGPNNAYCDWAAGQGNHPGGYWTDTLLPGMSDGGNVAADADSAAANDPAAPGGTVSTQYGISEHPQSASGHGGSNVGWGVGDSSTSHQVVAFSGSGETRHTNNVNNFSSTCNSTWGSQATVQSNTNGTRQQLLDMLKAAAQNCNSSTQLVVYISGHGDTDFDIGEWWRAVMGGQPDDPIMWDPIPGWVNWDGLFPLHAGWPGGLAMIAEQGLMPDPKLWLNVGTPLFGGEWELLLNGCPIPLPPEVLAGEDTPLPVDWPCILAGDNLLELLWLGQGQAPSLEFSRLELGSGRITEGSTNPIPEPASMLGLLAGAAGLAAYIRRRRNRA